MSTPRGTAMLHLAGYALYLSKDHPLDARRRPLRPDLKADAANAHSLARPPDTASYP